MNEAQTIVFEDEGRRQGQSVEKVSEFISLTKSFPPLKLDWGSAVANRPSRPEFSNGGRALDA